MTLEFTKFLNFDFWKKEPLSNTDKQIQYLLDNNSIHAVMEIIDSGYKPKENIMNQYLDKIDNLIITHNNLLYSLFNKDDKILSPKQFALYFSTVWEGKDLANYGVGNTISSKLQSIKINNSDSYNNIKLNDGFDKYRQYMEIAHTAIAYNFLDHYSIIFKTPNYQEAIFNAFIDTLSSIEIKKTISGKIKKLEYDELSKADKLIHLWHILDIHTIKNLTIEQYSDLKNKTLEITQASEDRNIQKHLQLISNKIDEHTTVIYKKELDNIINEAKLNSLSETATKKALNQHIINAESQFSITSLPKKSIEYIDEINTIYTVISKNQNNDNESYEINKMISERLPKVINSYLSMEPDYRDTMTNNQGKSAQDLLLESLESIKDILEKNLNNIQQDKLSNLSTQNRFLKKVSS